jgi:hypothetical protein
MVQLQRVDFDATIMTTERGRQLRHLRRLIEDCCGWNRKIWADAIEFAIANSLLEMSGKKALEIGAGEHSALAPVFSALGAAVTCSYYGQPRERVADGRLKFVMNKYRLENIELAEADINNVQGVYDIIVLKSVLGGVCRSNDYQKMKDVVDRLMRNLSEGGCILSIDNGFIGAFDRLRQVRGAGKNNWTYIKAAEFASALAGHDVSMRGFGLLNFGSAGVVLGIGLELVNDAIYFVDKAVLSLFGCRERAVLSTVIRRKPTGRS